MKRKLISFLYSGCMLVGLMTSCQKETIPSISDFSVATENGQLTYRLTDTVKFVFTGNPDALAYYSGEEGHNYDYRNRTVRTDGKLNFSFQTRADNIAGLEALSNGLMKVLFSNSFTSAYSTATVPELAIAQDSQLLNTTSWVDITNRFFLPDPNSDVSTYYPSNTAIISDLITDPTKPINIAFKMSAAQIPSTTNTTLGSNGISISSFNLYNLFPDSSRVNYNLEPGGSVSNIWKVVNAANAKNNWATSTTTLKFRSDTTSQYTEDWAVSTAYNSTSVLPDLPVAIKNISNNPPAYYLHRFNAVGTYKVVFIASNNRPEGSNQVEKELTINITQ